MKHFLSILFIVACFSAQGQVDTTTPPYKRFPALPPIQILLSDSTTLFTKADLKENKPLLLMVFSPECSHCQHETEEMIAHKNEMKDIQIVLITMYPFDKMRGFISKYKLDELSNVVVGRDINYFTPGFYNIRNLPFMAMYDKKGQLIGGFEGSLSIPEVIQVFNAVK